MTPANYTYVALGLQVVVGLPLVWASAVVLAKARIPIARAFAVFALGLLSGLLGFALAFLLGRMWMSVLPSHSTVLLDSVLLPSIIGPALIVFALHSVILQRFFCAPRQVAMLTIFVLWVCWYVVGSLATWTAAAILL